MSINSKPEIQKLGLYLQLLDWSESKRGMRVVFEVMDHPDHPVEGNPFKAYTSKNGKLAGQIFAAALVEVDPGTDEAKAQEGAGAAQPAATRQDTNPPDSTQPAPDAAVPQGVSEQPTVPFDQLSPKRQAVILSRREEFQTYVATVSLYPSTEAGAAEYIRDACGIRSRAVLDVDPHARQLFQQLRSAFTGWQAGQTKQAMRVSH